MGIDPIELRRRNMIHVEDLPFKNAGGERMSVSIPRAASIRHWQCLTTTTFAGNKPMRCPRVGCSV